MQKHFCLARERIISLKNSSKFQYFLANYKTMLDFEAENERVMQNDIKGGHLGTGKVYKSAKYFTLRVFDSAYNSDDESADSDISLGESREVNEPTPETAKLKNKQGKNGAAEQKELEDIGMTPVEERRLTITPKEVVQVLNDTVQGLVQPKSNLENKILQNVTNYLTDTVIESDAEQNESNLLAALREGISKLKCLCIAEKNYLETLREIFQLLEERWKKTGRMGVPRSAKFLAETRAYLSEVEILLKDMSELVAKGEEALAEFLAAKKLQEKRRATYNLNSPISSKLPVIATQASRIPVLQPQEGHKQRPVTGTKPYTRTPMVTSKSAPRMGVNSTTRPMYQSNVYQETPSTLRQAVSRNPPPPLQATLRPTKAATDPHPQPQSLLQRIRATSATRGQQRPQPLLPAKPLLLNRYDLLRRAREASKRLSQVHTRVNNLITYTQGTLDMLNQRYPPK